MLYIQHETCRESIFVRRSNDAQDIKKGTHTLFLDDDGDFYSVTLAFRQTTGNKADGGQ